MRHVEEADAELVMELAEGGSLAHQVRNKGPMSPREVAEVGIAIGNAEVLSSILLHQLKNEGAPFVYGTGLHHLDMRTTISVYGAPEFQLARVMAGETLAGLGLRDHAPAVSHVAVKEAVFPFVKFPGVDSLLGPEMKSTGEVMGIDRTLGLAVAKSQLAAGQNLPTSGTVFVTVMDEDKAKSASIVRKYYDLGFNIKVVTRAIHKAGRTNRASAAPS